MAGLFDQYEQASTRAADQSGVTNPGQQPISTGFISATLEDEAPMFSRKRINFEPKGEITHMVTSNHYLVIVLNKSVLKRIDIEQSDKSDEIELPKASDDKIFNIFLDPTAQHLIICMHSTDSYYLHRSSKKPRLLGKLKGHHITAVGWNKSNVSESSTAEILMGTTRGCILETEIVSTDDGRFFQSSLEKYVKQHLQLLGDKVYPVTGLELERMPTTSLVENSYFIIATLPGRLYQFNGSIPTSTEQPIFTDLFAAHENAVVPRGFLELPGNFGYSQFQFYRTKLQSEPTTFAWMTGPGVLTGRIKTTDAAADTVISEQKLVPYALQEPRVNKPLSVVITQFHILVLFADRLRAICMLNERTVHEDIYPQRFGQLLGMVKDPVRGSIWTFSSRAVFKYTVFREARDVWRIYLEAGQYDQAKQYCKDSPAKLDQVLTQQAQYLFSKQEYTESALIYAQTQASFEEITLKFIRLEQKDALKAFLQRKLNSLNVQDKAQVTMLSMWLLEIFLNELGAMRERGDDSSASYSHLQQDFRHLLSTQKVKDAVDGKREMVYELIASHGDIENLLHFAVLMRDFERVISHHVQHENFTSALDVLNKQPDMELFYRFSPVLMQSIPDAIVDAWITRRNGLDARKLIPALVQYDHQKYTQQGNAAIRYLEYCVQELNYKDEAIHNYLLSLYAKLQPDKLMIYLNYQGHDADLICYDLKYALRLCSEHEYKRACVHIYSVMGLYEEAVDLAIQIDIDLAKANAEKPEEEESRKKLWLKIARHVVEKEQDIQQAMQFLQLSDLLNIQDILPFFPDFVTIDHFKDAICSSLAEYNEHIEHLQHEMNEATHSAHDIRAEIQTFRNKFTCVKAQDKCSSCGYSLMTRAFHVFPCHHSFHTDCLVEKVLPHLSSSTKHRVEELQRQLAAGESSPATRTADSATPSKQLSHRDVKDEMNELVAAECIYCGEVMIRSVDQPFIDDASDQTLHGWT